ncbi:MULTISPECIES: dTDP-4-dehydrorhamnose 3,5-epimerase [Candidatus Cardinium]|uniref:dTDP-4-dehydrorhamnose 3,5-epimerase n=1 Tax=Candidatus Cardinium TaxID=273135 RepID=UPI001FAA8D52|nr:MULTISPECIES: dTDP-4-dehydrorhamnose 3,5-epimerase [Cardinium]
MQLDEPYLVDLVLLRPTIHYDSRGYFFETYHKEKYKAMGLDLCFIQENQSLSKKGTVRGLHYQLIPYAQSKLVRVVDGVIWDVVVDLRKGMDTFGKWQGFLLSSENQHQIFIPKGFAHGFIALSNQAIVAYKCDAYHCPNAEQGIHFQDPTLNIPWEDYGNPQIISAKDAAWPLFQKAVFNF